MNFVKYSSLENHTNDKFLSKVFESVLHTDIFVAREKIHGTNFSVIITKDSIVPAKRTGPILETEKFFGYEDLMAKYDSKFKSIQSQLSDNDLYSSIQIFGEYAGGGIQKEVDYGEKDFYVFDVLTTSKDGTVSEYWPDRSVEAFTIFNSLKIAPLIKRGTLEELLKLPVEYNSVVKAYDHLFSDGGPLMANSYEFEQSVPTDNVSEGLVIKPCVPKNLDSGSRIAIKYKTDAFKEKGKGKAPKIPVPMSEKDKGILFEYSKYVTKARISNVISHIGEVTAKDFGKVLGLTMRDIFVESEREGLTLVDADVPSKLKAELQKIVQSEIRSEWVNYIS